jgi:flagellar hook-basal body complex protein FliE
VNSITEDLGYLVKAEVTTARQLRVEVKLDEDNPEARYLWAKLDKGKQYGMSVKGSSMGWYWEVEKSTGQKVRKHPQVHLDEVSATTRPMYVPSFGTVLQKAIDEADASVASAGETTEMSAPTTNGEVATTAPESSAPENDTVTKSISPSEELVRSLLANDQFVALVKSTVESASSASNVTETTGSVDDSTEVVKGQAEATAAPDIAAIVKSAVAEASVAFTSQLEALAEKIPEVSGPGVLTKSEKERDEAILSDLRQDPRQALRVGLAARHNELDKL